MRDLTQLAAAGEGARPPVPPVGSAPVVDPLDRAGRALELLAVISVLGVTGAPDLRERAWRRIRALVEEIDEDATGPQDVVRR